ncbi:MAG: hypothetical protein ACRCUF_18095 [Aeromonas sobria]
MKPIIVETTPMSADYFGMEGPTPVEEIQLMKRRTAHFTQTITVPKATFGDWHKRILDLEREIAAHGLVLGAVISHPGDEPWKGTPGEPIRMNGHEMVYGPARSGMSVEAMPLEQELKTLLAEDEGMPWVPMKGKGVMDCCQHGVMNLDYCRECDS